MKQLKHTLIHHFLEYSAQAYPDKIALIHEKQRTTYAEINNRADILARRLIGNNVEPGDRIIIILENSVDYVVSYYGVLKAGAVAVPLSTDIKPNGLNILLAELDPAAIISNKRFNRLIKAADQELLKKTLKLNLSIDPILAKNSENCGDFPGRGRELQNRNLKIKDSDLACIIFTSGSTGKPKGVMLSHANIVANVDSICQYLELTENDIQMVVLPFFYVMGKSLLNTHFAVGGTVVINNKFAFPASVIQQMAEENVTGFSGVPSTYAYLLHRSPLAKYRAKLPALRYCAQAGGHMARQIKEELPKVLPAHTKMFIMYGATEAGARLTYLNPDRYIEKMDSIGMAIPNVKMKVLDKTGQTVGQGESGELVANGDNIFMGYWKDREVTKKALDENGYHTGDTGYQDEEGYLYITGRKDDLVKVGGHRINPQEVEDALVATDLVVEAAVLGIPDKLLGNKLMALAVSRNGDVSAKAIRAACYDRLPKNKMPESITLIRSLPKHPSGKVNKEKCREIIGNI